MVTQRDNRMKVSAFLRAGHKVSEIANLVGLAQSSIKKRIKDGKSVTSFTSFLSFLSKTSPSNGIPQAVPRITPR